MLGSGYSGSCGDVGFWLGLWWSHKNFSGGWTRVSSGGVVFSDGEVVV